MEVVDVPEPLVRPRAVLVRTHHSLISPGTEGSTVRAARLGLVAKARQRPQQVRQLLEVARQQGPLQAYRAAMKKLEARSPLGYSAAGEVCEVGPGVGGLRVGDLVACGGNAASHAEVIVVPERLCARLEPGDDTARAAYNTLGAIALQGIRQADARLGETVAVIGLGLLGQLTCLLLRAAGVRAVGIDVDPAAVASCAPRADLALLRSEAGLEARVADLTAGLGVDAVVVTASTRSTDPVDLAGRISRDRGRVVVVGDVPTGFAREAFYRKELELRMSRSTGPGRYDPRYEDKGLDYPPGYVRWTEQRNMAAFQALVRSGRVDPAPLTTHVFPLERAKEAFDLILRREEPCLGVLLRYEAARERPHAPVVVRARPAPGGGRTGVSFFGAGSYASGSLLPELAARSDVAMRLVLAASGTSSRSAADRFGFEACAGREEDVLDDPGTQAVFVATRHDSHARLVVAALERGKHVFVEKPLCLTLEELAEVRAAHARLQAGPGAPVLLVGYNRRFAPLATRLAKWLGPGPHALVYRVNAGSLPDDSWLRDPATGGGRIVGEACHFVDLAMFLCSARPLSVSGVPMRGGSHEGDTAVLTLSLSDGSVATIAYLANGSRSVPKERIEVSSHGRTAVLDDFRSLELHGEGGRPRKERLLSQDKGQRGAVEAFLRAVREGGEGPVPAADLFASAEASILAAAALWEARVRRLGE